MKGENYLYFCDTTASEPDANDEAVLIPASTVLGISVGNASGFNANEIYLSAQGPVGDLNGRAAVEISVQAGKHREAMDDIAAAINSNPSDGFVVIYDALTKDSCSSFITGISVDTVV